MRLTLLVALLVSTFAQARADVFPSIEAFVDSVQNYNCEVDRYKIGYFLSVEEPQQPELSPKIVSPKKIDKVEILWRSEDRAIISIISTPQTESMPSKSALLISLTQNGTNWAISDKIPFHAFGKYADISFKFTGGDHSPPPVVTITTSNGGRGASYTASATYELLDWRLTRMKL